ncbi:MAG: C4-dicarboxylate ABC transporter [Verrucomicrobiaceae bacterium]|nr:MAG: C4-dicarboxylate ABC transporter [Verrucomicrobiaceae bacterium]
MLALKAAIKQLPPSYFALVMATGIVSIAAHQVGLPVVPEALFGLNIIAYAVLCVLNVLRLVWFPGLMFRDLVDHRSGPGFFTWVAASCVLGTQFIRIAHEHHVALVLWIIGILLWLVLTYTIFTALTIKEDKPTLSEGITGAWLLGVVATQSVAVLGALLAPTWEQPYRVEINFFALSMWLWGGMLYIWMISLIFYRYTFFKFSPGDLTPPYWINMGAMAISTLAGSLLILNSPHAPFLRSILPFLKGFTVFYWATGTWWIPMLVVLGAWRYFYKRFPFTYDPLYWGAVFPLGMYTVATLQMSTALELPFLRIIPRYFVWIALTAWSLTFIGMVLAPIRTRAGHRRRGSPS